MAIFFMAASISVTPTFSEADPSTDRNLDRNGDDCIGAQKGGEEGRQSDQWMA